MRALRSNPRYQTPETTSDEASAVVPDAPCGSSPEGVATSCEGIADALYRIAQGVGRLAAALENLWGGLGDPVNTRYTSPPQASGLVDEKTMAATLGISNRILGKYRREGRLPGCWIRNGGRIHWRVAETLETWKRGIA